MPVRKVYFIGSPGGPIKIGVSDYPAKRLISIQTGCSQRLSILATMEGDEALERHLHKVFARSRLSGEWFAPSADLLAFVWDAARDPDMRISLDVEYDVSDLEPLVRDYRAVEKLLRAAGISKTQSTMAAGVLGREAKVQRAARQAKIVDACAFDGPIRQQFLLAALQRSPFPAEGS